MEKQWQALTSMIAMKSEREGSILALADAMVYLLMRSESPTCPIYSDSHVVLEVALSSCISTSKIPVCAIMRRPVMQKYIYITESFTRCAL